MVNRLRAFAGILLLSLSACTPSVAEPPTAVPSATAAPTNTASPVPVLTASPLVEAPTATPFPLDSGWWDDAACYEVFVRSFSDSNGDGIGDLQGLIQKLDYINDGDPASQQDLGANCIWLMPIMTATSYHGYDVTDYYAVNPQYGTADDFKQLMSEAHKRGIKVILDLVLNHTSVEHPWFQDALSNPDSPYRDWYIWSESDPGYNNPWGEQAWHESPTGYYYGIFWSGMPDLNYRNPAVTAEARKISLFWLNDMGADGFRLDAIKHLIEDGQQQEGTPETHAWLRDYRQFLQQNAPGSFTIGEIFDGNAVTLADYYPDQLDSYFEFGSGESIIQSVTTQRGRPYLNRSSSVYEKLPYQRWSPFLTNHDQNRVMGYFGGDMTKAKLAATALLTLPGMPFVYYGEEIGMTGEKPDERIRTPMQWENSATGGFTSGTPWEALQPDLATANVASQSDDPDSLLNHYRRLFHLHTQTPALAHGDLTLLNSEQSEVAAFVRQSGESIVLVLINFGGDPIDGLQLSVEQSGLDAGSYTLTPLLGEQAAAPLTVGEGGAIQGYMPFDRVEARSSAIFLLTKQ